jgi:hypothetical protein
MNDQPLSHSHFSRFARWCAARAKALGRGADRWVARRIRSMGRKARRNTPSGARFGLDPSRIASEQDALQRYRLAREIYTVLTSHAAATSVRFGLFGEWGYGKTTIANWVAEIAKHDGHWVAWFNPWACQSVDVMWFELASAIHTELERHGIELSAWAEIKTWGTKQWKSAGSGTEIINVKGIGGLASRLLRFSEADIDKLRAALGERRVIVIVDDMDRADPKLLPKLLLALREILDLEHFSFLIPFDKAKVASAVHQQYAEWDGDDFLEKIFDYQLKIPPTTADERWTLFEAHVRSIMPNTLLAALKELQDSLPDNPRRIKRIVRGLELMKREIERHGSDEIDWKSVVYALILQLESEAFFDAYVKATFLDMKRRMAEAFDRDRSEEREEARRTRIEAIAQRFIPDEARKARVVALAMKWENDRAYWDNHRVIYALQLFARPHAFTWEEVDQVMGRWRADKRPAVLVDAIADVARAHLVPDLSAFREFADSLRARYHEQLSLAADLFRAASHEAAILKADEALVALLQLATSARFTPDMRAETFEKLCEAIRPYAHFIGNDRDREQRAREVAALRELCGLAGDEWQRFANKLDGDRTHMQSDEAFQDIRNELLPLFDEQAKTLVIQTLRQDRGIRSLVYEGPRRPKRLFFDAQGGLWTGADAPLVRLFADAADNAHIQRNAHTLLRIAAEDGPSDSVSQDELRRFLATPHVGAAIWRAAVAQPIQFRLLMETRRCRAFLGHLGLAEALLPFPDWLRQGEERDAEQV